MHSSKHSSASKFHSDTTPHSVRAASQKALTLDALSTEGQQVRIKKIIQESRKGGPGSPNAIVISQAELLRMRNSAVVMSKEDLLQQKKIMEEQNEKQQAAANAKRQKMMEIEAERRKNIPPSEAEMETAMKNEALKAKAHLLLNEERDDVKQMNQMMLYAKVVTIRDRQLLEKKELVGQLKVEEKRKDLMMEIDRLEKIKYFDEIEKKNKEDQRKAAFETIHQIKERELERLREQEEREKEGQEMLRNIKQLQKEEQKTNLQKKRQQKGMLDQIYESNQKEIAKKNEKILEEKQEEDRILQYNIEKSQERC